MLRPEKFPLTFALPSYFLLWSLIGCCLFAAMPDTALAGNTTDTLRIRIREYPADTLWFGVAYGRGIQPFMAATPDRDSQFVFVFREPLEPGTYGWVLRRAPEARPEFHTCLINGREPSISIETDIHAFYARAVVTGSPENAAYFRYMDQYALHARQLATATDQWKMLNTDASWKSLTLARHRMHAFQTDFITQNHGTVTAELIRKALFQIPPTGCNTPECQLSWLKRHFLDPIHLPDPEIANQPLWLDMLDFYIMMMPPPQPDSVIVMADQLLDQLAVQNPRVFGMYVPYLLQMLEPVNRFGMDELFVHLVKKYVLSGQLPGMSEDRREFLRLHAERLERLFIGQKAPNLALRTPEGHPLSLYQLPARWTILVFWLPDCQLCQRELPQILKVWSKRSPQDLQVVAVCGRSGPGAPCWAKSAEWQLPPEWHLAHDPDRTARFQSLYNVRSYPHILVIDPERRIRFRQAGAAPPRALEGILDAVLP